MKRELKVPELLGELMGIDPEVTRHIPMKRELKVGMEHIHHGHPYSHKAYPDEKGTESPLSP